MVEDLVTSVWFSDQMLGTNSIILFIDLATYFSTRLKKKGVKIHEV